LVLLAVVSGGAGGFLVYYNTTPVYRSTVSLIVSGAGNGQQTDELTARVLATQRAFALSKVASTAPAIAAASTAAGYPNSQASVSATSDAKAPFLTIQVVDSDPTRAQAIADAYETTLPTTLVKLEGGNRPPVGLANLAPASAPGHPISPIPRRDIGLGLATGLVLGLGLSFLRQSVDGTLRDSDELQEMTSLSVLGTVPRDLPRKALPAVSHPRSARTEAYRQVRTTLLSRASLARTLVVTSAGMGDGKTSLATNLAAVFARAGHRVALVDADLRRPRVTSVFGVRVDVGLTEVLSGTLALADALVMLQDGRLGILPSGRIAANPSEALHARAMGDVLAKLAADFEFVIVDTPPVLPVADALVLAPKVDGVLLVVRLGHTTRDQVRHAVSNLERVNAEVLGVVANQAGKGTDLDYRYPASHAGHRHREQQPKSS